MWLRRCLACFVQVSADGFVEKLAYIDLMDMKDPTGVSPRSRGGVLNFPFVTIEDVDVYRQDASGLVAALARLLLTGRQRRARSIGDGH